MKRLLAPHEVPSDAVLLDARPPGQYLQGHLPGARQADLTRAFQLRSPADLEDFHEWLAATLGAAGLVEGRSVVAYDNGPETRAARAAFLAEYAGFEAAVLRGGVGAWLNSGRQLEGGPGEWQATRVRVAARPGVLATAADLIAPGDRVLIDARAPEEYRGEAAPPAMPRRGRLPDALSLDWRRLTDEAGILDDAGLERVLAGVPRGREVVVYCQSAARSAVLYQALRHLGFDARNYLGSAGEWLSDPALPVESGPGREL